MYETKARLKWKRKKRISFMRAGDVCEWRDMLGDEHDLEKGKAKTVLHACRIHRGEVFVCGNSTYAAASIGHAKASAQRWQPLDLFLILT